MTNESLSADKRLKVITGRINSVELLAGLAEECCELGQAALKLRRVYDGQNPTPVSEKEAIDRLYEEAADVQLYLKVLYLYQPMIDDICNVKLNRWVSRLSESR